ncbi:hypothetical protein B0T21DRAFT_364460 [Apiosordaria backusii]|uniref:Uncharacterized protein n=1 Tax=Apiosordaria backusii TaxID=314023 RepID=A0AA40EEN7_9PEZI|nr:hypothetical protein B0T21DRAFT_364460 [Apiosordaria backusii]
MTQAQDPRKTTVENAPMIKRLMMEAISEALRGFSSSKALGKRLLDEDASEGGDDGPSTKAEKKQKTVQAQGGTDEQTVRPRLLPGPDMRLARLSLPRTCENIESNYKPPETKAHGLEARDVVTAPGNVERAREQEMGEKLAEISKAYDVMVTKIVKLEQENSTLRKQMNELSMKYEAMNERQKAVVNGHEAMEVKMAKVEQENQTLRNQMAACFQRLELLERGHYIRPALQHAPAQQLRSPFKAGQQQGFGGGGNAGRFYNGPTYSRPM